MTPRHVLVLTAAALLLTACGGSSTPSAAERADSATPASSATPATAASAAAPAATADAAAPVTSDGGSPQPVSGGQQQPAQQATTGGTAAGTEATAAGKYTFDSSGTVDAGTPQKVDGTATLTVDPPAGGRQHSALEGDQGSTAQDVVVRADGTYLARLTITNPAFTKEFAPAKPVLFVPDPATPGRSWSWTMTSTDGKTTAALTARVARTETLTIGGASTSTAVVESTMRITGDVTYTGETQTWYDAAHRLTVKDHTKGSGTVSGIAFTTDITSVLRSTKPA